MWDKEESDTPVPHEGRTDFAGTFFSLSPERASCSIAPGTDARRNGGGKAFPAFLREGGTFCQKKPGIIMPGYMNPGSMKPGSIISIGMGGGAGAWA